MALKVRSSGKTKADVPIATSQKARTVDTGPAPTHLQIAQINAANQTISTGERFVRTAQAEQIKKENSAINLNIDALESELKTSRSAADLTSERGVGKRTTGVTGIEKKFMEGVVMNNLSADAQEVFKQKIQNTLAASNLADGQLIIVARQEIETDNIAGKVTDIILDDDWATPKQMLDAVRKIFVANQVYLKDQQIEKQIADWGRRAIQNRVKNISASLRPTAVHEIEALMQDGEVQTLFDEEELGGVANLIRSADTQRLEALGKRYLSNGDGTHTDIQTGMSVGTSTETRILAARRNSLKNLLKDRREYVEALTSGGQQPTPEMMLQRGATWDSTYAGEQQQMAFGGPGEQAFGATGARKTPRAEPSPSDQSALDVAREELKANKETLDEFHRRVKAGEDISTVAAALFPRDIKETKAEELAAVLKDDATRADFFIFAKKHPDLTVQEAASLFLKRDIKDIQVVTVKDTEKIINVATKEVIATGSGKVVEDAKTGAVNIVKADGTVIKAVMPRPTPPSMLDEDGKTLKTKFSTEYRQTVQTGIGITDKSGPLTASQAKFFNAMIKSGNAFMQSGMAHTVGEAHSMALSENIALIPEKYDFKIALDEVLKGGGAIELDLETPVYKAGSEKANKAAMDRLVKQIKKDGELLDLGKATGIWSGLTQGWGIALGNFFEGAVDRKTQRARFEYAIVVRDFIRLMALNKRFAVQEQLMLKEIIPDVGIFNITGQAAERLEAFRDLVKVRIADSASDVRIDENEPKLKSEKLQEVRDFKRILDRLDRFDTKNLGGPASTTERREKFRQNLRKDRINLSEKAFKEKYGESKASAKKALTKQK